MGGAELGVHARETTMQMSAPGWLLLIACATLLAGAAFVAGSPFKNQSPLDVEASASKLYSKLYVSPEYSKLADIVLGTPLASFHNATLQVYKKILEDHGHTVQTVTNVRHPDMYPYFTGANGKTPYIDMVVSSDLPNNHAPWLKDYKGTYEVMGTCYELLQIFLAAPAYTGITSLTELKASTAANKTIIGFDLDPCARCPDLAAQWIREDLGAGWTYLPFNKADLPAELTRRLAAKEVFVSTWWSPSYWNALFPAMKKLDMEKFTSSLFNQGKALIAKRSRSKFSDKTLSALGAVFIGNDAINAMDYAIYQLKQEGGAAADNAAETVALKWIADNQATYNMFSW